MNLTKQKVSFDETLTVFTDPLQPTSRAPNKAIKASALADPRFKANPYPFYARMRAEAPVFPVAIPLAGRAWMVTRYEDVISVATDDRFSRDVPPNLRWLPDFALVPLTRHMLSQDPPNHGRLRKLVSQAFTPRRIELLRERIQVVCDELLPRPARAPSTADQMQRGLVPAPSRNCFATRARWR